MLKQSYQLKSSVYYPINIAFYRKYRKIYESTLQAAKKLHNISRYLGAHNKWKVAWSIFDDNVNLNSKSRVTLSDILIEDKL
ncbi:hypothetical protein HHI36_018167, partial [Cryptolaemus montrouzieri]